MQVSLLDIPVVVINLDSEPEKLQETMQQLISLGFKTIARVSAQPAVEAYRNKVTAVAKSHLSALSVFPAPFIVVEDDIEALAWANEVSIPDTAEALSLGNMQWAYTYEGWKDYPIVDPVPDYPEIRRVVSMVGGHAWLYLSSLFVEKMREVCTFSSSIGQPALAQDCRASRDLYPNSEVYVTRQPMFVQKGKYHEVTCLAVDEYQATGALGFNAFFKQKDPSLS